MSERNNKVLDKLAHHEESISELYNTYARIFPALCEFWSLLSKEENKHATWIRTLSRQVGGDSKLFTNERRFHIAAIDTSLDYLRKETDRANKQSVTMIEALSIAFYVEQSLIESKFFEVFETDSVELKHLLQKLYSETVDHRAKVQEVLDRQKKS